MRDLASRLGVTPQRLVELAEETGKDFNSHYSQFPKMVKQKVRIITEPDKELKTIQQRIKQRILEPIGLSESAHGGVAGRSTASNARQHLGQRCIANVDVRGCFPSIRPKAVYAMFLRDLGFGRDVSRVLTKLTTANFHLPQGAPTSTPVANLLMKPVDVLIEVEAHRLGARTTRYIDDVTFSGDDPVSLINLLARLLSRRGLSIHRKKAKKWEQKSKLKIQYSGEMQEVTGLTVNSKHGPSVGRKYRSGVRMAIHRLGRMPETSKLDDTVRSLRGKILHVRQFNTGAAKYLKKYLDEKLAEFHSNDQLKSPPQAARVGTPA